MKNLPYSVLAGVTYKVLKREFEAEQRAAKFWRRLCLVALASLVYTSIQLVDARHQLLGHKERKFAATLN